MTTWLKPRWPRIIGAIIITPFVAPAVPHDSITAHWAIGITTATTIYQIITTLTKGRAANRAASHAPARGRMLFQVTPLDGDDRRVK